MRSHTIAVIAAAAAFQISNIGIAQAQNATEKLALGMPITMDDLRGQEFIGRLTQPNSKTGYSVKIKFDNAKPKVEVVASEKISAPTNFDEPTLTAASSFANTSLFVNFKTMEVTTKDGAIGMLMHSDFGCWFRETSFGCPIHTNDKLVAKYKATFQDLKSENKAFEKNSKTQNTADAYNSVIKPRMIKFAEMNGAPVAPAAAAASAQPSAPTAQPNPVQVAALQQQSAPATVQAQPTPTGTAVVQNNPFDQMNKALQQLQQGLQPAPQQPQAQPQISNQPSGQGQSTQPQQSNQAITQAFKKLGGEVALKNLNYDREPSLALQAAWVLKSLQTILDNTGKLSPNYAAPKPDYGDKAQAIPSVAYKTHAKANNILVTKAYWSFLKEPGAKIWEETVATCSIEMVSPGRWTSCDYEENYTSSIVRDQYIWIIEKLRFNVGVSPEMMTPKMSEWGNEPVVDDSKHPITQLKQKILSANPELPAAIRASYDILKPLAAKYDDAIKEKRDAENSAKIAQENQQKAAEKKKAEDGAKRAETAAQNAAKDPNSWVNYEKREKTLLETILNYSSTADENGKVLGRAVYWISGKDNANKCVMTNMYDDKVIDLREMNEKGFRIKTTNTGLKGYIFGDEKTGFATFYVGQVMERMTKAWGIAFRECPGKKSAF